jgi:hypothetical protein
MIRRVIADDDGQVSIGVMPDNITPAVICSHPGKPSSYHPLRSGESAFNMPVSGTKAGAATPAQWNAAILAKTGTSPPVIVCALLDQTNTVQQLIRADPAIDAAPSGFTMVKCYDSKISVGCTFDPIGRLFTQPSCIIPANSPGNQTASPVVVQATVIPNTGTPV